MSIKKMGLHTFSELAESLSSSILATAAECTRIYIIFYVYRESSINQMERARRSSYEQITVDIMSDNQKLNVDFAMFWGSILNKTRAEC